MVNYLAQQRQVTGVHAKPVSPSTSSVYDHGKHAPSGEVLSSQRGTESPASLRHPPVLPTYTVQDPLRETVQSSGRV